MTTVAAAPPPTRPHVVILARSGLTGAPDITKITRIGATAARALRASAAAEGAA